MNIFYSLHTTYWREPLWLLLALQPFIIVILKKIAIQNNLSHYADKKLQPWVIFPIRMTLKELILNKNTLYILAWILFSIALAGPRTPLQSAGTAQQFGANIMLVVDASRSMQATDISPNRLRRAKIEIHELLDKAQAHRIGITVFSARPHLFVPVTSDHKALKSYLDTLDNLAFPTTGSDPVAALLLAKNQLTQLDGHSVIILISDGDFSSLQFDQLTEIKQAGIPVFVLGIGTVEGEAVQLKDGSWLKHNQRAVISKMNEDNLRLLASHFSGNYSPVYDDDTDWKRLYEQGIVKYNNSINLKNNSIIVWHEYFAYFLFPALILFWISLTPYRVKAIKTIVLFGFVFLITGLTPNDNAFAAEPGIRFGQTTEQAAFMAYHNGNFAQAEKLYQSLTGYNSHLGQGNSLYKMGHYKKAQLQFSSAVLSANDDKQRVDALYNLANCYFRSGAFTSAIASYEDVLRYQPDHQASAYNIKVSQILKKNIELRIKENEKTISTPRQGRGSRSAAVADGSDINDNTSVSIDGSENKIKGEIPLPDLPDINADKVKQLLSLGLENIKLAKFGSAEQQQTPNETLTATLENNIDLNRLQQQLDAMSDSQYLLWKRLFEMEEGFPAPVENAKTLPGVNPW